MNARLLCWALTCANDVRTRSTFPFENWCGCMLECRNSKCAWTLHLRLKCLADSTPCELASSASQTCSTGVTVFRSNARKSISCSKRLWGSRGASKRRSCEATSSGESTKEAAASMRTATRVIKRITALQMQWMPLTQKAEEVRTNPTPLLALRTSYCRLLGMHHTSTSISTTSRWI